MTPTLAIDLLEFRQEVGDWRGYGRGEEAGQKKWTDAQLRNIDRFVKEGYSKFVTAHDWSFLRPWVTLTLVEGEKTVDIPEEVGGVEGQLAISISGTSGGWTLDFGDSGVVYRKEAEFPDWTGQPQFVCKEPIPGTSIHRLQRERFRFHPIADQDYTLRFQGYVTPDMLRSNLPYAWGGAQHHETILQSMKAAAERNDKSPDRTERDEYDRMLMASIKMDRRDKPQNFGFNTDKSDMREWMGRPRVQLTPVTIAGVSPE